MIYIIDRTIPELGEIADASHVDALRELLVSVGIDSVEEAIKPPVAEFHINDVREARTMALAAEACKKNGVVRLRGFDDILLGNWETDFSILHSQFDGIVEFCPSDNCGLATATAIGWALTFQKNCRIITTFGGIGNHAAFEEVAIALKLARIRKVGKNYPEFPKIAEVVEKITGQQFPQNKPIIGREVYRVKSGIHIDGMLKQPKCYTPFPPEDVGQTTEIALSKQSGKSAVEFKMKQLNLNVNNIEKVLKRIKQLSINENRNINDDEFRKIVLEVNGI